MKIALLGAESTGKTQLAIELAASLRNHGHSAIHVPEMLRTWREREGRMPRPEELLPIAHEQERQVDAASAACEFVIADTTALMVAIYGAVLYDDDPLYRFAMERQRSYDVTLVTGLDLAWVHDGLARDASHPREEVDALVREALQSAAIPYRVIYGHGPERLANALGAIEVAAARSTTGKTSPPWLWACEKCSDPDCEHRLFSRVLRSREAR